MKNIKTYLFWLLAVIIMPVMKLLSVINWPWLVCLVPFIFVVSCLTGIVIFLVFVEV